MTVFFISSSIALYYRIQYSVSMSLERPRQEPEETPNLRSIDLSELQATIEDYNKQYHIGGLLADSMFGAMGEERKEKITLDDVHDQHQKTLQAVGLNIEPVRAVGTIVGADEESSIHASELRLNLSDGKRFTAYLGSLDESALTPTQIKGLKAVAESLTSQLTSEYQLNNPEDERVIELFGSLENVITGYRSLDETGKNGLAASVEQLATYLEIAREKYLREYLIVKQQQLLTTNQDRTFGPYDWQKDSTPETFRNRYWGNALAALREVKKNPYAGNLFQETVKNLGGALKFAKQYLKDNPSQYRNADDFNVVIDDIYEELQQIAEV